MVKARRLSAFLLLILCLGLGLLSCTNPALALVIEEQPIQTELDAVQDWGSQNSLTPEGNLTLVDDVQTFSSFDKEFLTVQTKGGHYFYIIIERDSKGKQTVHFLNQVDESDLLALLEDAPVEKTPPVCICRGQDKCYIGSVNTACEVCAVNMKDCLGNETVQAEPEPTKDKSNSKAALGVLLILLAMLSAGGFYLYKSYLAKKANKQQTPDFDDEDEEDEELENYPDESEDIAAESDGEEFEEDEDYEGDEEET